MDLHFFLIQQLKPYQDQLFAPLPADRYACLKESVLRHGVQLPLLVTPHAQEKDSYLILDGRHRWQVAQAVGLEQVPCLVLSPEQAAEVAAEIELYRRHLSPEEWKAYHAQRKDWSRRFFVQYVEQRLIPELAALFQKGKISLTMAGSFIRFSPEQQYTLWQTLSHSIVSEPRASQENASTSPLVQDTDPSPEETGDVGDPSSVSPGAPSPQELPAVLEQQQAELQEQVKGKDVEIARLQKEVQERDKRLRKAQRKFEELLEEVQELRQRKVPPEPTFDRDKELQELHRRLVDMSHAVQKIEAEKAELLEQLRSVKMERTGYAAQLKAVVLQLDEHYKELKFLHDEYLKAFDSLAQPERILERLTVIETELQHVQGFVKRFHWPPSYFPQVEGQTQKIIDAAEGLLTTMGQQLDHTLAERGKEVQEKHQRIYTLAEPRRDVENASTQEESPEQDASADEVLAASEEQK